MSNGYYFDAYVDLKPVSQIIKDHGLDENGDVQLFLTNTVDRRITRYMPYLSGVLATKLKRVKSPTEILISGPYAKYTYFGKLMVGNAPKVVTGIPLNYTKTHHPLAGPFWDRRLMAAEGKVIANEVSEYIRRIK